MQKKFVYFLIVFQVFLLLTYWIWYEGLTEFLPGVFGSHAPVLQAIFTILAFALPLIVGLAFSRDSILMRSLVKIIWIWMPVYWYGFLVSAVCWFIFAFAKVIGWDLNMAPVAAVLYSLAALGIVVGYINARIHRITNIKIKMPNLPEYWKGKTLALLTDLHVGHILRYRFVKKVVRLVNEMNPEVVLISGDYYDGVHTDAEGLAAPFKDVKAPLGTYFVSGNHDSYRELSTHIQALENANVKVIDGQSVVINGLQLIGEGYNVLESVESVSEFLDTIGVSKDSPSILLKHIPSNLKAAANAGVSLVLCGHTHHGQLWPFNWVTYYVFRKYHIGLNLFGDMLVFTSSGVGTWGAPFRLGTKSEIVQITLE
jgi:uncharacterized protein